MLFILSIWGFAYTESQTEALCRVGHGTGVGWWWGGGISTTTCQTAECPSDVASAADPGQPGAGAVSKVARSSAKGRLDWRSYLVDLGRRTLTSDGLTVVPESAGVVAPAAEVAPILAAPALRAVAAAHAAVVHLH